MSDRVLIYRRFSSDDQEYGSSDTLTQQLERCQAYARDNGWTVNPKDVLTDKGRSAFKGEHLLPDAALGRFVDDLRAGLYPANTVLLADRLDRLSRSPVDKAMAWIHTITSLGVRIAIADTRTVFASNPDMGTFLAAAITASVAHEESRKKSERKNGATMRLAKDAETKTGKWVNLAAKIPSWLERNATLNGWIEDKARSEIVREIYQMSADGLGTTMIAQRLNDRDPFVPSFTKGDTWSVSSVRQLLLSPTVEGDFVSSEGVLAGRVFHGFFPRIVPADVVAQARKNLKDRNKGPNKRQPAQIGSVNMFAGLSRCGECGRRAQITTQHQKGREYKYLFCQASKENRCGNVGGYAYLPLEATTLDLFLDLALEDRFFSASSELHQHRVRKAEIEKAINDKRAARTRFMDMFEDDHDDQLTERIAKLRGEIKALEVELEAVEADIVTASGKVSSVEHLKRVGDIREAASSADEAVRDQARQKLRMAMTAIISSVELDRQEDGTKVFTVILLGGVMAVRIDTRGKVLQSISDVGGKPMWAYLSEDQQESLAPLIARIEKLAA
jgi:DNA invertase Pin-like site-specific DNA recombinase